MSSINRRTALTGGIAAAALAKGPIARAASTPGVTPTTLKIGNTMPYSGPASTYGNVGKADSAFFKWVNDQGGVGGRKIEFLSYDDGYSPPKTVEQVRRLVEQDQVDFLFATLGTACNTAIVRYCNQHKVPQLFVGSGADKWGNYKEYPWTIGLQPSYRTEAQIYTRYMLKQKPDAKLGILYQNDDFGKDYPIGVRDILGPDWDKHVVRSVVCEPSDATVDSQIVELQSSGADVLLVAAIPKFAAQAIRRMYDINWKPMFFMTNTAISVGAVIRPAGPEKAIGMLSTRAGKDPADPAWDSDPGMQAFKQFMAKYLPGADVTDYAYMGGYGGSYVMWKVLQQCNGDFSRENVMKQATSIKDMEVPVLLPGIKINTSPTNYHPIRSMQLARWDGKTWVRFGEVIEGAQS